jgi:hypothetical protein
MENLEQTADHVQVACVVCLPTAGRKHLNINISDIQLKEWKSID